MMSAQDNVGKAGFWIYYTNDENKARWKCSLCGKIVRRMPDDKRYCSNCGAKMGKPGYERVSCM